MGIIYYHTLSDSKKARILGLPEKWFWALGYAAFSVFIECILNLGGHLVWEYPFWYRSFQGVWLIFLFGYFHFFCFCILVMSLKTNTGKVALIGTIYAVPIVMNILAFGFFGWNY
jgi:hypothetical protein